MALDEFEQVPHSCPCHLM